MAFNKGIFKVITKESRDKAVETRRERGNLIPTDEVKKKMSDAHMGQVVSDETKRKIGLANKGKVLSEETKQKIRDSKKLNPFKPTEEQRRRISETLIGNKNRLGGNSKNNSKK